jgi:hypothetical protein
LKAASRAAFTLQPFGTFEPQNHDKPNISIRAGENIKALSDENIGCNGTT